MCIRDRYSSAANFYFLLSNLPVSYTHLRAHETSLHLVCRLLLEKITPVLAPACCAGFLMIRRPPRSTHCISSAASDVYKRQVQFSMPKIGDFSQFWDWKFPIDLRGKKDHQHRNFFYSETLYELTKIFIYGTKTKVPIAAHNCLTAVNITEKN